MYPMSYTPYQCPSPMMLPPPTPMMVAPPSPMMVPQPPMMVPQPPMMVPQPPMVVPQPPVMVAQPPLVVPQPPVVVAQPPMVVAQPPVVVAQPPVVVAQPPLMVAQPPVVVPQPPVLVAQPPVVVAQPSVIMQQPIVHCPAVAPSAIMPSININNTNTNQNQLSSMVGAGGRRGGWLGSDAGWFGKGGVSGQKFGLYEYTYLWNISLFSCQRDWYTCMYVTACYPCYVFYLANFFKESLATPLLGLLILPPTCCAPIALMRSRMRNAFDIDGSLTSDAIITFLCGPCVICQMMNQYHYTYDSDTVAEDGTIINVAQPDLIRNGKTNGGYRYCVIQ